MYAQKGTKCSLPRANLDARFAAIMWRRAAREVGGASGWDAIPGNASQEHLTSRWTRPVVHGFEYKWKQLCSRVTACTGTRAKPRADFNIWIGARGVLKWVRSMFQSFPSNDLPPTLTPPKCVSVTSHPDLATISPVWT